MTIDLTKYERRTPGTWRAITMPSGDIGIFNENGMRIGRMKRGPDGQVTADAPKLLAEVVKLREEVEFRRGVADGARQSAAEKLAEADQLRAEPSEALIKLRALVDGLDATHWSSWQSTGHFSDALEAAREFLAKHGGA